MTAPAIPQLLQPAQPNLLSNTRGSNTSGDAIQFKVRYSNPRQNADPALAVRAVAQRTGVGGAPQSPTTTWDSGWVGGSTVNSLPVALDSFGCVQANGRIYVTGGQDSSSNLKAECWSAPFRGGSVGTWRQESALPFPTAGHACCTVAVSAAAPDVAGFIYVIGGGYAPTPAAPSQAALQAQGWFASIGSDGQLGAWLPMEVPLPQGGRAYGAACQIGWNTQVGAKFYGLPIIAFAGGANALTGSGVSAAGSAAQGGVYTSTIKTDGSMWETFWQLNGSASLATGAIGHFMFYESVGSYIYVVGGIGTGGALRTIQDAHWNSADPQGAITFSQDTLALPAARAGMGAVYQPSWVSNNQGRLLLLGGTSTTTLPSATNLLSSIIFAPVPLNGTTINTWTTSTRTLAAAEAHGGAAGLVEADFGPAWGTQRVAHLGGRRTGPADTTAVQTTSATPGNSANDYTALASGVGTALTAGNLGTGGALASNQDGTQDATFLYGGFGQAIASSFADGDWVQLSIQFMDQQQGDLSPIAFAAFRVGQPPTLSSIAPSGTITNGQPTASFLYSAGAGGGSEYSYQIQVKLSGNIVYDTGVLTDNLNLALLKIAPLLAASTTYTLVITATAQDQPYPGSSVSATSSPTFSTSAFTVPGTPGSFTATPSGTNANVALSWSAATGSPSYYRVYYRRNGTSTWYLLADNVAGTSYTAVDEIALGVAYDFAVSAVTATPTEGSKSSTQTATVPLSQASGWLHIAGQGVTYNAPVYIEDTTSFTKKLGSSTFLPFNQRSPIVRYGPQGFQQFGLGFWLDDIYPGTTMAALQSLTDQIQAGNVAVYRNAAGAIVACALEGDQQIEIQQRPGPSARRVHRTVTLKFTEVADTVGPYVSTGQGQGYLTLVNGSKPPLDPSERLL
jgi:hypothetical protein